MKGSSSKPLTVLIWVAVICVIIASIFFVIIKGEEANTRSSTEAIEMLDKYERIKSNPKYQEALNYVLSEPGFYFWKTEGPLNLFVDSKYGTVYFRHSQFGVHQGYTARELPDGTNEVFSGDWMEVESVRKAVEKYLKKH